MPRCEGLGGRSVTRCVGLMQKQVKHWLDGYFEACQKALILREVECGCDRGIWEEGREKKKEKKGKQPPQTHKHTRPCHTPALHTRTHTSAPSNNPLILFIISQLFLVRAIHERNHTHKHTPMCRAEIQYKYTHLYFLISSSIFTPCFFFFFLFAVFFSTLRYASATRLHITIPHQCTGLTEIGKTLYFFCFCVWRVSLSCGELTPSLSSLLFLLTRARKKKKYRDTSSRDTASKIWP